MFRTLIARLLATLHPQRHERRLQEEIDAHLDELAAQQPDSFAGRRAFGSIESMKEQYRDQARFRVLENLLRDVRFALRQYAKTPGFTVAAILSLALGIGANAALFSLVNAILIKSLPVPQPDRLYSISSENASLALTLREVDDLNRQASRLGTLLGSFPIDVSFSLGSRPEWISAELVTGDYFRALSVPAELGRTLTRRELDAAAGNPVCVISHRLWQSKFAGTPGIIGRTVFINTHPYIVVGVSAPEFHGVDLLRPSDLQIPATRLSDYMPAFASNPKYDWRSRLFLFSTILRLNPSVTRLQAEEQIARLHREYLAEHKLEHAGTLQLSPASGGLKSHSKLARPAAILLGVSLVVLFIACANLATLLLSRTSARLHEFTLRLAIGGSPARIFSQVLVESMLLALFGTIAAVAMSYGIARVLLGFLNRSTPAIHQLHISVDAHILAFTAGIAVFSVLLFGVAPALQASRARSTGSFSAGNTRSGAGLRKFFVVTQVALSFLVVLSAGLFAQTLRHLATLDLGYAPDQIAAIDIRPASGGYTGERADRFYKQVVERLRSTPGVKAAATALGLDLDGGMKATIKAQNGLTKYQVNFFGVSPGYFNTFDAHIVAGTDFNPRDTSKNEDGYIISEHFAQTYFHGQAAAGNYLLDENGTKIPVVGVVSNLRDENLRGGSLDTAYQNIDKLLASSLTVYVRCHGSCTALLPTLRKTINDWDPNTPVLSLTTMQTQFEGAFATEQALGFLSLLFALLALVLTAAGLYGVLSYMLTRRTREIGIRTAVGALPSDIVRLFAGEALVMLGWGTLIGIPVSLGTVTLLRSQLFGVTPHDPSALILCFACILGTVVVASLPPIRRALAISPQQALRIE